MDAYVGFSPRLLFVENNKSEVNDYLDIFESDGYVVKWSADSSEVFNILESFVPNIILIKWGSISLAGLDLCQTIRSDPNFDDTFIVVISENYKELDAVRLFLVGVDDYIRLPVSNSEILARIWARLRLLRQKNVFTGGRKVLRKSTPADLLLKRIGPEKTLSHKGIMMNVELREVRRHGQFIQLRDAEFRLLAILLENPQRIHTRNELINSLWEQPDKIDFRTIDVMVARLRKALSQPNRTDAIRAVRGLGYGLSQEDPVLVDRKSKKIIRASDEALH